MSSLDSPIVFTQNYLSRLEELASLALKDAEPSRELLLSVLDSSRTPLLPLLEATRCVREHFCGKEVRVQILNNLQNGMCTEDCNYCAQSTSSCAEIKTYPMKSDEEIMDGAQRCAESGANRYCMVLSGRAPSDERVAHLAGLVKEIKKRHSIEVCVSAGFIDAKQAATLKQAGLDRYNHNLNTSSKFYDQICSSHSHAERLACLEAAKSVGLDLCSGLIIGMGESAEDVVSVAMALRRLQVKSVPVNFYMHIPGSRLGEVGQLTPEHCLRVLCLFRFAMPKAEIRAAGGREINLRSLQPLALFAANSLFCEGYLNTSGQALENTKTMIRDAGFVVGAVEE
jgi:biotin synthase